MYANTPGTQRLGRGPRVGVGGDHDDRDPIDAEAADLLQELEAAHSRHVHVEQSEIELFLSRMISASAPSRADSVSYAFS